MMRRIRVRAAKMIKMQLDRILQSQGFGSRKQCRQLIEAGRVVVAGQICAQPGAAFELAGLAVTVDDVQWTCCEKVYLALNKPADYECSQAPQHHASVYSLLPAFLRERGVQCVGRLDADTTGLLLMSDDGQFNHALASPKRHVPKTYRVFAKHVVTDVQIAALMDGVLLHDETAPLAALSAQPVGERELLLTIDQGKYHQVKRMLAAAGNRVERLHREAMGQLGFTDLPPLAAGEWCLLDTPALQKLR